MQNSVYKDSLYNEYIFLNHEGQLREYKCFRKQFKNFLKEEGLDGEHINFHQFRHIYATLLINNGENPRVVQELLGHKDLLTTLNIYTSVNINTLRKASIKYASIFKEVSE